MLNDNDIFNVTELITGAVKGLYAQMEVIVAELKNMRGEMKDMRAEMNEMRGDIQKLSKRTDAIETSFSSYREEFVDFSSFMINNTIRLHKRVNALEKKKVIH